jgi:hypothetical protein
MTDQKLLNNPVNKLALAHLLALTLPIHKRWLEYCLGSHPFRPVISWVF